MKRIVLEEPTTWAIVCLISGTVAEQVGPDVFGVYLAALGVAAAALAHILFPKTMKRIGDPRHAPARSPQSASWRKPQ